MRLALALLIALHGSIHAMGFVKAFSIAELSALRRSISRAEGLVWLGTAGLFVAGAVLLIASRDLWWVVVGIAVFLSQLLIVIAWRDARFGTIANLIILVPLTIAALQRSPWSYRAAFEREAALERLDPVTVPPLRGEEIAHLPGPVQSYLHFAGAVGRPRVARFRVNFRGAIRQGPTSPWMPSTALQVSTVEPASRLFLMDSTLYGLPFQAWHRYVGASATMRVKVASLVTVIDAKGRQMDQSETVTLFNDMCLLAPAALIDPDIRWEVVDSTTVKATFTNVGQTISARLSFDAEGALVNFWSDDRYRSPDGITYDKVRWSTPVREYRTVDGRRVPAHAEATWALATGEFTYARFELLNIEYN